MKTMLITFFDIKGIVHLGFIPQGQTVKQAYVETLKWLCEAVYRERSEILPNDCIVQHDKTPAHKALSHK
jgi:hypothetical protein